MKISELSKIFPKPISALFLPLFGGSLSSHEEPFLAIINLFRAYKHSEINHFSSKEAIIDTKLMIIVKNDKT